MEINACHFVGLDFLLFSLSSLSCQLADCVSETRSSDCLLYYRTRKVDDFTSRLLDIHSKMIDINKKEVSLYLF